MAWLPISWTVPQYLDSNGDPYSGAVLKFYQDGTTTNTNMATDNTGGTTLADVVLDSNGYPSNGGSIFIPHIDQAYKLALYPTEAAADADTGAIWTIDNLTPADLTDTDTDELAKVSSNDTTAGYLNGKLTGGTGITLTENTDGGNETLDVALTGDGLLITESADHNNSPAAGKGEIWVKSDAPNVLYFTDDDGNDFAISGATAPAGYDRFGKNFIVDGSSSSPASFDVATNIATGTYETVGPTGSGATNIWTAMDAMPTNAVAALFRVQIQLNLTATGTRIVSVYGASGATTTPLINQSAAGLVVHGNDADSGDLTYLQVNCECPVDSSQIMKIGWGTTGSATGTESIFLYWRGWMID